MYKRPRQAPVASMGHDVSLRQPSYTTRDTNTSVSTSPSVPVASGSSSATLSARKVPSKHNRSDSQIVRTGVQMPTYTILRDPPPWETEEIDAPRSSPSTLTPPSRTHVPSSIYSNDLRHEILPGGMATVEPLNVRVPRDADYAHPQQEITDASPLSSRPSRLPLFKQVRSMLQRQSPQHTTPTNVKWDEYSGEISADGKVPQVQPSKYVSSYEEPFDDRARSVERRTQNPRDVSPISVLRDDELFDRQWSRDSVTSIPISPLSVSTRATSDHRRHSFDSMDLPLPPVLPSGLNQGIVQVRRKPAPYASEVSAPSRHMHISEQYNPPSANSALTVTSARGLLPDARLSWASYAHSMTSSPSTKSDNSPQMSQLEFEHNQPGSRFSWTTVGTSTTWQTRPATMASSIVPPVPSVNHFHDHDPSRTSRHGTPDSTVDSSVLTRSRPIKRLEQEEWVPRPNGTTITPRVVTAPVVLSQRKATPSPVTTADKALPPPPELQIRRADSPLSHLESLLVQDRDLALQHANMSRGVADLESLEHASPLEVSFATVRDARKRLAEYRTRISEIELEQREVGILIARARRKEGVEEGLWVRRVTS